MAIRSSERAIGDPPIPTVLEVNDETGSTEIFSLVGGDKQLIATSTGKDWEIKTRFRGIYNRENAGVLEIDLDINEVRDRFNTEFVSDFNNDRAKLINDFSSDDVRRSLKEAGYPRVKDPDNNTTSSDTTGVPSTADNSSSQGGDTNTTTINTIKDIANEGIEGGGMPSGSIRYPIDMDDRMNKLQINIIKYEPKGVASKSGSFQSPDRQKGETLISIFLPVPGGISDQNQVSWNRGDMNALEQAAAEFAVSAITEGAKGAEKSATEIVERLRQQSPSVKNAVAAALAGAASGLSSQLLTRESGAIINPNAELLFNGPTMRNFGFSFNMSARSENEARAIKIIIRALKQGMSVRRSQSGLFLLSPNIFELKYMSGSGSQNPHLNKFKMCAMTAMNVNYTPNQSFMTFKNDMPVAYQVDMQFTELEPIFNDDYKDDNSIGF